ncbi:MAG: hypothetical protein ACHQ2Z_01355 [Elusimicrobiota bacterium]
MSFPSGSDLLLRLRPSVSFADVRRNWGTSIIFGLALAVLLGIYLAFPDKVFDFDGVYYGFAIEGHIPNLKSRIFDTDHPLFLPGMMLLRGALTAAGAKVSGYELIQRVNACAGAFGLWLYRRLLARTTQDEEVSLIATLMLGVSFAYLCRATEGQVYMLMTVGALAVFSSSLTLLERPSAGRAASLVAIWILSVFFHLANGVLLPVVAAALWLATPPERRLRFVLPILCFAVPAGLIGCWMTGIHGPGALPAFVIAQLPFFTEKNHDSFRQIAQFLEGFSSAFLAGRFDAAWRLAIGVLLCAGLAAATLVRHNASQRRAATIFFFGGSATALLLFLYNSSSYLWPPCLAALLAFGALNWSISLKGSSPARRRLQLSLAAALVFGVGGWNAWSGVRPRGQIENNPDYSRALFVRDHTLSTSWVMISGLGFSNSKVYLTQFARRSNRAFEYFLGSAPKASALAGFKSFIQDAIDHGLPVYALSDLIDDPAVQEEILKLWGVTPEEVKACFGPGEFRLIASYDANLRIYLFVPADRRDLLFAGLTFNVLDMNDLSHVQEIAPVLRQLAAEMTPAQRRHTAALLKETRYGALTSLAGISPSLDAASRPQAEAYARGFMKSPGPQPLDLIRQIEGLLAAP